MPHFTELSAPVLIGALFLLVPPATPLLATEDSDPQRGLNAMSLDELTRVQVTSVAKKKQSLRDAPAAISVITQEDIRRSTATSVPELLRMVPGLQVARINSSQWAISSRGFDGRFTNKMLVMVDGRSVYTPLFSGVYWDAQDIMPEDIDRIEVIRGPGATMWGANAVNGVISIHTKHARETQGALVTATAGNADRAIGGVRYGGKAGNRGWYRGFARASSRAGLQSEHGGDGGDSWQQYRGGFRMDFDVTSQDSLTVEGDTTEIRARQTVMLPTLRPPFLESSPDRIRMSTSNVLGRWQRNGVNGNGTAVQLYYDRSDRSEAMGQEMRNTLDIDAQHSLALAPGNQLMVGLGYRLNLDTVAKMKADVTLNPPSRTDNLFSSFVQDEIEFGEGAFRLSLGSKIEHNDYTGIEVEPGARLAWAASPRQDVWAAISRAVRTPSQRDFDLRMTTGVIPGPGLPISILLVGSRQFRSEVLAANEFGYRFQPALNLSFDAALFLNRYTHLASWEAEPPVVAMANSTPYLIAPMRFDNRIGGRSYGGELTATWAPLPQWRLAGTYSLLRLKLRKDQPSTDSVTIPAGGSAPRQQAALRSYTELFRGIGFDNAVSYTGPLTVVLTSGALEHIPGYTRVDMRVGRRFGSLEISAAVENLLNRRHIEYHPEAFGEGNLLGRSACVKLTWRN